MKDILSDEQKETMLNAMDEAIKNGPWSKSRFLRAIGKNLNEIRENFVSKAHAMSSNQTQKETALVNSLVLRSGQQEVFISLYSADGNNIQSWERIIINLPKQMISRPIYTQEEHVKALLKTKENKLNEAYVAVSINKTDVIPLPPDKAIVDKLGNSLLSLKDNSLDLEHVSRFVHFSGVYQLVRGRLIKKQ